MSVRYPSLILTLLLPFLASPPAKAADWSTGDGLAVSLDDGTGAVSRIAMDGPDLPLLEGSTGGLSVQEFVRESSAPARLALSLDFEGDAPSWTSAAMGEWDTQASFAKRGTDGAAEGEGFLRIGDGKTAGAGMAAMERVALSPGEVCTISWKGRTPDTAQNYILCLRLFDRDGRDVTAVAPPPAGWLHTPYSNAHYTVEVRNTKADTWEPFSYEYVVPDQVASAQLSLRVYRGGALQGDIDDLRITVAPSPWSAETSVRGRIRREGDGLVQRAELVDEGLGFVTEFREHGGFLTAMTRAEALDPDRSERCLRLKYSLPLDLDGWTWSTGPRTEARIDPERSHHDNVGLAGHPLSRYPVASVHDDRTGLAMATRLDRPALQSFSCGPDGLVTTVDLGLSADAPDAVAAFTLVLYRHEPSWGFRAALERYYELFPERFGGVARRGGIWTLRLPDVDVPNPGDFGLAFYECSAVGDEARSFCRTHDIAMLPYIEPWGVRQTFPDAESRADMPPYEERMAALEAWAAEPDSNQRWLSAPRNVMARAVLNSVLLGPDGMGAHYVDRYTHWAHWWQLNSDPDLPRPNRAGVTMDYEVEPALEWADGIYVDSVSLSFGAFEDHDRKHFAAADRPLAFSMATGTPVVLSGLAHYEFLEQLQHRLHAQGKLLMMNLFPPATRLYGYMADIAGSELAGAQDDVEAMQQRIYAYHRPISNLLQWRFAVQTRVPAMTPEEMETYFSNQLTYGFWPGISTAGGGTQEGYAGMHRYFRDPDLYERDRPLFRKYIPVFDALNRAGWEPVPHARSDAADVWVERFGPVDGTAYLTVHNPTDEAREVTVALDREWWCEALGSRDGITVTDVLTGDGPQTNDGPATLSCRVELGPRRTSVLRIEGAPAE